MALQTNQEYVMCVPELSPNQSPHSASPIPEQNHSPRGNLMPQEHSWNIILEPHGNSTLVHFIDPNTGDIVNSTVANYGDIIQFEPGVFFQVPHFPQQSVPMQTAPMPQPQPMYMNVPPQNVQQQNFNIMGNGIQHEYDTNPYCPSHGNYNQPNHFVQNGNIRPDKRREKPQKKMSDKQPGCTCRQNVQYNEYNHDMNEKLVYLHDGVAVMAEDNGGGHLDMSNHVEVEKDLTININPKALSDTPYAIIVTWDECILSNSDLHNCLFDLQVSESRNKYKTVFSGQTSTFRVTELQPGSEYSFRICAIWNKKKGPFSEPVVCCTLQTTPTSPNFLRIIQKTKNAVTLKWNLSTSDGGSPITSYSLQWHTGQEKEDQFLDLYTGSQKQFKHSHKLPPGTQCFFRVRASNEIGNSEWSNDLKCLTSAGPPSIPKSPLMIDCGTNFIRMKWHEPESNGAPVEEYKLEMEDPNDGYGFIVKYHGDGTSYCCQNLRRNTKYSFRLSASNNQGFSRCSNHVSYSTLPEAPGKMEKPKVNGKVKTNSISVKWDAPRDSGGNETISYVLECDSGNGGQFNQIYQGTDQEFVVSGLIPGATYKVRVASESRAGKGSWSPVLQVATLPVVPKDCLPPICVKAESNCLHLEWAEPNNGGAKISSYVIQMTNSLQGEFKQVFTGVKRACSVMDLLPGTDYSFRMKATNEAGTSHWSTPSTLTTAPSTPEAPDLPIVSFKTPTHLRLDWTEPVLHGADVTSYSLEKLENEHFQKVYQGVSCFCDVKRNLLPATHYYFRLQAHSNVGDSSYSDVFTVETPPSAPGPVTEIKVIEQTSNSCLVQWRHPVENGSRVNEYMLEATGATSMICTATRPPPSTTIEEENENGEENNSDAELPGEDEEEEDDVELHNTSSSSVTSLSSPSVTSETRDDEHMEYRLTGLTADASYKLRIQAINSVGTGLFSHPIQFFTKELPPQPPSLNASSMSYNSIKLKWGDSASKKALSVLTHTLQLQNKSGNFSTVYSGMGASYTMSKLNELTPYCCRIRSRNEAGEGEFSKPKIFYTKARPPPVIKGLECKSTTQTSFNLSWSHVDKIRQDDAIEYRLQVLDHENGAKDFKEIYQGSENSFYVDKLQPESAHSFRVHALRYLSDVARSSVPATAREVKGVFGASPLRVKTCSLKEMEEKNEAEAQIEAATSAAEKASTQRWCNLTDTHLALIILCTFLLMCGLIAGGLRWMMGELQL